MVEREVGPTLTPAEGTALARLAVASIAARLAGLPQDGRPPESPGAMRVQPCVTVLPLAAAATAAYKI